ncbi:hypothetical protein HME9302_02497 [Alteripontixanthobacter maritimus]|uniref:Uncharacterized protein n=1 Tax=Alteripontixanthobacter maritimus TaxID=2161824 RepID=A0A369QDH6_9SPHN|nr:hypothetical protein [Alteripontixanthobacter maritimus]RDC61276.1 hypothetical protein HME9302_02497 [Alteripontixanthobacter maritimus]
MATKEDILEQVVEEFLIHRGYFVQHNVKFLPRRDHPEHDSRMDSNHSDIDIIGFHPKKVGPERVVAVSCKSWQNGFRPSSELSAIMNDKTIRGRKAWQGFRELTKPKWSEAFVDAIEVATGSREFTYFTAVSKIRGDRGMWENHKPFQEALGGNPVRLIGFKEMLIEINDSLTTTMAGTEVGRLLQMFNAAGIDLSDP